MKDIESNNSLLLNEHDDDDVMERRSSCSSSAWKWLLAASLACLVGSHILFAQSETIQPLLLEHSTALATVPNNDNDKNNHLDWHIKPIHPHHTGRVVYLTESTVDNGVIYKRVFTVPCAYGMLVFNVGPAASYEPYSYDVYEDAYAYSDNKGLCVLYPSYTGTQTASSPLWNEHDLTDQTVPLGDNPTKISTRVVKMPNTKDLDAKRGGDFVIMRSGNFYNPGYYKHLKAEINRWPGGLEKGDMQQALNELVQRMDEMEFEAAEE